MAQTQEKPGLPQQMSIPGTEDKIVWRLDYYKNGLQTLHFSYPNDFKLALAHSQSWCDARGLRFGFLTRFLTDLKDPINRVANNISDQNMSNVITMGN